MLVVRVETDWYAHETEFRYVLQPGEGISGSHSMPIGQVLLRAARGNYDARLHRRSELGDDQTVRDQVSRREGGVQGQQHRTGMP